ncbi:polyamine aminopropyltransferase [Chloroflexi bacterium]|nr:polyamine aminopropyltransferase [Chloroflexota bacterium]
MKISSPEWHIEPISTGLIQAERITSILCEIKTQFQHVMIIEGECFGRSLILDGKTQSTELDEFVYHEGLVHPSMISHKNPKKVLIIGGGEGATAREVLKYRNVEEVTMVDIDRELVELCQEFLPNHHVNAFSDPRLKLHYADALEFVESSSNQYDVIIMDVPDPLEYGPAYQLFTLEFFHLLKEKLNFGGIIVIQAGATGPSFSEQCFTAVAKTLSQTFSICRGYEIFVPSFGSTWGFITASEEIDPSTKTRSTIDSDLQIFRINKLKMYDGISHESMFQLPKYTRENILAETRVITKSNPLFTYQQ